MRLWFNHLVDLFFPPFCCSCGRLLVKGEYSLCSFCQLELPKCRFSSDPENPVALLFWGRAYLQNAGAFCLFSRDGMIQSLVHQIKYREGIHLAQDLGAMMGEELKSVSWINEIDGVTNIPLHHKRLKERGYNQSVLLGKGLAEALGKPFWEDVVVRKENTISQTSLEGMDRWENVKNAFDLAENRELEGKHVLLVDDVITTGATIEACANQLLKMSNTKVSVFSLSFAGS